MPVTTWSTNASKVALPNTYHQPVRGGTGCSSAWRADVRSPLRSSSQAKKRLITPASRYGNRTGEDFHLAVSHLHRILRQWMGGRAGGHRAVGVVHATVAGAEEKLGLTEPAHRATQVGTVDRERGKLGGAITAKPRGRMRGDPRPRQRRSVLEGHVHGLAHLEMVHWPDRTPHPGRLPDQGGDQKADYRDTH